ncbi:hypothetical protein B0H19DRAFT_1258002 [Mycena capillaripes]|nr:hypothetical protein B0H19DRAFT_1258002 [Mycena capillaripes]
MSLRVVCHDQPLRLRLFFFVQRSLHFTLVSCCVPPSIAFKASGGRSGIANRTNLTVFKLRDARCAQRADVVASAADMLIAPGPDSERLVVVSLVLVRCSPHKRILASHWALRLCIIDLSVPLSTEIFACQQRRGLVGLDVRVSPTRSSSGRGDLTVTTCLQPKAESESQAAGACAYGVELPRRVTIHRRPSLALWAGEDEIEAIILFSFSASDTGAAKADLRAAALYVPVHRLALGGLYLDALDSSAVIFRITEKGHKMLHRYLSARRRSSPFLVSAILALFIGLEWSPSNNSPPPPRAEDSLRTVYPQTYEAKARASAVPKRQGTSSRQPAGQYHHHYQRAVRNHHPSTTLWTGENELEAFVLFYDAAPQGVLRRFALVDYIPGSKFFGLRARLEPADITRRSR